MAVFPRLRVRSVLVVAMPEVPILGNLENDKRCSNLRDEESSSLSDSYKHMRNHARCNITFSRDTGFNGVITAPRGSYIATNEGVLDEP